MLKFPLRCYLTLELKFYDYMSKFVIRTSKGDLNGELYEESAPQTVQHFIRLVNSGFYDGLEFFKYVPGVLIQTGCPKNDGTGSAENYIKCELKGDDQYHKYGTLGMAHAKRDHNGSQFYICLSADFVNNYDKNNTCFGKVADEDRPILSSLKKGDIIEEIVLEDI